ncbi:MAG: pyridoxamine 5'-phosphate oxidase family protein, partial [Duncaniella sp.]|nr:pyridoxamine 5'-phosphate oxidase family protein [Duncaniella sp.]
YFRSVIVFGHVRFLDEAAEKTAALMKLCEKYCKGIDASAEIDRFINTVAILEVTIDYISGKQSIELVV